MNRVRCSDVRPNHIFTKDLESGKTYQARNEETQEAFRPAVDVGVERGVVDHGDGEQQVPD